MQKISAVIVTFEPQAEMVIALVSALFNQVSNIIVIDNSLSDSLDYSDFKNVKLIRLNGNKGIAYAQNIGFLEAIKNGADYVITFDQDSIVESDFVSSLLEQFQIISSVKSNVVCIGPTIINSRNGLEYDKKFEKGINLGNGFYSVKTVMSSGSLYPIEAFAKVGLNKSEWFIDSVELEWCYRAVYKGCNVVVTRNVAMSHNLGCSDFKFLGIIPIVVGSPSRLYYIFRNWIHSLREPSYPIACKFKLIFKIPVKFFIFSTIYPRRQRFVYMMKGIIDGILNKVDKIE